MGFFRWIIATHILSQPSEVIYIALTVTSIIAALALGSGVTLVMVFASIIYLAVWLPIGYVFITEILKELRKEYEQDK